MPRISLKVTTLARNAILLILNIFIMALGSSKGN